MSGGLAGALLGLTAALGLLLVVARLPFRRRSFAARVEPYLGLGGPRRVRGDGQRSTTGRLADAKALAAGWLDQLLGGDASVRRRLDQLGGGSSEEFRISQLTWAAAGLAAMLALVGLRSSVAGGPSPVLVVVLALLAGAAAALARDRGLSRAVARRHAAILNEFPAVADLLALAVTPGEGPLGALQLLSTLVYCLRRRRWRGIAAGLASAPGTCIALLPYRKPVRARTVLRDLARRAGAA